MQRLVEILKRHGVTASIGESSDAKMLQNRVERYNAQRGNLKDYDCVKCLNKGNRLILRDGHEVYEECDCLAIRQTMKLIKASGLEKTVHRCTFDTYKVSADWQRYMLDKAKEYARHPERWFFVGGQVGAGKTHLCTAIVGELLKRRIAVKYCLWRDESTRLKVLVNDTGYDAEIKKYKLTECLYIDDLFKTKKGASVTPADISIAFEILNYRYINDMLTIISSEKTLREMIEIDEAVGSRIFEMSKGRSINLKQDKEKDYRVRRTENEDDNGNNSKS